MRPQSSVVTISTVSVSIFILINPVCIVTCFGRVEMGRGSGIAGSDSSLQSITPGIQFLASYLGEPVGVIQATSLCHPSAATPAATPLAFSASCGFLSPWVMTSTDALWNPEHSASRMANVLTTPSLAQRGPNMVAQCCCISGRGSIFVLSSLHSSRGLARSASVIFLSCDPFGVHRADNQPVLRSISAFLASNHAKPNTGSYAALGTTKTSDWATGSRCSKY